MIVDFFIISDFYINQINILKWSKIKIFQNELRNTLTTSHSLPPSLENVEIDNTDNSKTGGKSRTRDRFKNLELDPLLTKQESFKQVLSY